ncbi:hypothetical protein [Priestia endophytica]|jgi:hypothetical protein|uniref:hypothetical protein n=1 Tax=Priestia endophytica TaxID=135735 RepID=UPI000F53B8D5|nr:hypothetical protein [Priestia endophytica]MED4074291.1 hypothetical protein [Priestia endophytica]RPK01830.1 hypothetical protein FH5_02251 [Priestia endophytica]
MKNKPSKNELIMSILFTIIMAISALYFLTTQQSKNGLIVSLLFTIIGGLMVKKAKKNSHKQKSRKL